MLSSIIPNYEEEMAKLHEMAPAGLVMMYGFSYSGPEHVYYTYPEEWVEIYQGRSYYFVDPVFAWAMSNTGFKRWSEINLPDVRGVMKHARQYGMKYGIIFSKRYGVTKSTLSLARSDRELTDAEIEYLDAKFSVWVPLVLEKPELTKAEMDVLIALKDGLAQREIAQRLGIAESTVKQRALRICSKLKAKNRTHAVAIAVTRNYLPA